MKRNKWLACGLAVTMILGLGACGNNETASGEASASKGTDDVKQESTQTETGRKERILRACCIRVVVSQEMVFRRIRKW